MNTLEMETYSEPDFGAVLDEFTDDTMTEEQKAEMCKKTEDFYKDWTDDDWADLGNNY